MTDSELDSPWLTSDDSIDNNLDDDLESQLIDDFYRKINRNMEKVIEFWLFDNLSYLIHNRRLKQARSAFDFKDQGRFLQSINSVELMNNSNPPIIHYVMLPVSGGFDTVQISCSVVSSQTKFNNSSLSNDLEVGYNISASHYVDYEGTVEELPTPLIKRVMKE
jgi:hypothetical protein